MSACAIVAMRVRAYVPLLLVTLVNAGPVTFHRDDVNLAGTRADAFSRGKNPSVPLPKQTRGTDAVSRLLLFAALLVVDDV